MTNKRGAAKDVQWNITLPLKRKKAFCSNMNRHRDCHTKWSKSDREGEISVISLGSKNKWYKLTNLQNKQTHRLREWTYGFQGEGWREGIIREFGMDMYTLLYLKWITNKDLVYSTWNSAQCYSEAWLGGEFGKKQIHVYVPLSPFTVHLKLSQHC